MAKLCIDYKFFDLVMCYKKTDDIYYWELNFNKSLGLKIPAGCGNIAVSNMTISKQGDILALVTGTADTYLELDQVSIVQLKDHTKQPFEIDSHIEFSNEDKFEDSLLNAFNYATITEIITHKGMNSFEIDVKCSNDLKIAIVSGNDILLKAAVDKGTTVIDYLMKLDDLNITFTGYITLLTKD